MMKSSVVAVALALVITAATTDAVQVPGGGSARSDCYARFEVDVPAAVSTRQVVCADGDTACDQDGQCNDACRFRVAVCLNQSDNRPTCVPPFPPSALKAVRLPRRGPAAALALPPLDSSACGAFLDVDVPLKVKRQGRVKKPRTQKIKLKAVSRAKPRRDNDVLRLTCQPNPACADGGPPPGLTCPANEAGGPDTLVVTIKPDGNDLDNGWTGVSHNFPIPSDSKLTFCLSGCDGTEANPMCTATGATGADSVNTNTFGPPLPLVAGGVPVCVINRFATSSITSEGNLVTGEVTGSVQLKSDVFVTDINKVCPRCESGTCDSGVNIDKACDVDGTVLVVNSIAANKTFKLSKDCPPFGTPVSSLDITLPITTGQIGTPGTGGSKPCREKEAQGVPVKDNDCAGTCSCGPTACALGSPACTQMVPSPVDPTQMICKDQKGGLTQCCCSNNPGLSCQPTEAGNVGIIRIGRPLPPTPAVPDPTYPKVADGAVLAATFCEAATGNANIDTVSGLPGPGALLFNTRMEFTKRP
jgi:hypothetical protein